VRERTLLLAQLPLAPAVAIIKMEGLFFSGASL
jgi:hypothetical protein